MGNPCSFHEFCEQGLASHQEDAILSEKDMGLFIACDGLGGQGSGLEASKIAIKILSENIRKELSAHQAKDWKEKSTRRALIAALENALQLASKAIFAKAKSNLALAGMCTSIDLFLQIGSHALIGHVGAGRVYLQRAGELHLLTEDHTQLAHFRRIGKLDTIPVAQHTRYAKQLTRAVGYLEEVKVDFLELELQEQDNILICTDGVWQFFSEEGLEKIMLGKSLDRAAAEIHDKIIASATKENSSAIFIAPQIDRETLVEASADFKIKLTGKIPLFRYLSYQELIKVVSVAELFKVNAGTELCREGEHSAELMIILGGSADVLKSGNKLASLKKGEMFGEMSMLDEAPRSATIVAAEICNVLAFPRDAIFSLLREESHLCVKFLWGLSQELNKRLRSTSNKLVGKDGIDPAENKSGSLPFLYSKEIS